MANETVDDFIENVDRERFEKNRDYLMKLVEEDYKLIAWIAWGLELLFKDFSYDDMYKYILTVDQEELKKYIEPVKVKINSEDNEGVIFDVYYRLKENDKNVGYLGIENQLMSTSYEERLARGTAYICAIVFSEIKYVKDKEHYREVVSPTELWIFPDAPFYLRNHVSEFQSPLPGKEHRYNFGKEGSKKPVPIKSVFEIESSIYHYYLGSFLEINDDVLKGSDPVAKLARTMQLLDLIFWFEPDSEERSEMAWKLFGLGKNKVEKEIEAMSSFEKVIKSARDIQIRNAEIITAVKALKWAGKTEEETAEYLVKNMDLTPYDAKSAVTICY